MILDIVFLWVKMVMYMRVGVGIMWVCICRDIIVEGLLFYLWGIL